MDQNVIPEKIVEESTTENQYIQNQQRAISTNTCKLLTLQPNSSHHFIMMFNYV
jgi:hypothetical protein